MACELAERHQIPMLVLDTVVWEPGKIPVLRPRDDINADVEQFLASSERWVVEGCYGELVELALPQCTEAIFLNPGLMACVANNRRRPWEPHKYASREAQDAMLAQLLAWVAGYYTRDNQSSYVYHRRVFDSFTGKKTEVAKLGDPQ